MGTKSGVKVDIGYMYDMYEGMMAKHISMNGPQRTACLSKGYIKEKYR